MPTTKAEILELVKALPGDQQRELFAELEAMLPPPPPEGMTAEEFRAELDRRWEACEAGRMTAAPYEEVIERLRRKNQSDG
jgi:putative addiction module component (TIGR02574 family)